MHCSDLFQSAGLLSPGGASMMDKNVRAVTLKNNSFLLDVLTPPAAEIAVTSVAEHHAPLRAAPWTTFSSF